MEIITHFIELKTKGHTDIIDLTDQIRNHLSRTELQDGQVSVFALGSTAGITTLEFEPGLATHDVAEMLDRLAPYGKDYRHNQTWGDDNGAAHLRSTLIGTSYTASFHKGQLLLGAWQQIVFIDFDTRPRERRVAVQFMGKR